MIKSVFSSVDPKVLEEIKSEIIKRLKPLNPNKIILFGSYAYGTLHKDSDIDLIAHTKKCMKNLWILILYFQERY